jgi:hypothetical protein
MERHGIGHQQLLRLYRQTENIWPFIKHKPVSLAVKSLVDSGMTDHEAIVAIQLYGTIRQRLYLFAN